MKTTLSKWWRRSTAHRDTPRHGMLTPTRRQQWVRAVHEASAHLRICTDAELRCNALNRRRDHLRRFGTQSILQDQENLTGMAALMSEAIRRTLGLQLFDQQIEAGLILCGRNVCEMQTGEGKTLAMGLAAALQAITPLGVHVASANDYLATRDCDHLSPAFSLLGLSAVSIRTGLETAETQAAYQADITYAAGHTFGFDYLRDRATSHATFPTDGNHTQLNRRQRGRRVALVDEIDQVLIDDAISPLVLSDNQECLANDLTVIVAADRVAMDLINRDLLGQHQDAMDLPTAARHRMAMLKPPSCDGTLQKPWQQYVSTALVAHTHFHKDVDYVIRDNAVCVVDRTSGRVHSDRVWPDGLQQALEAKEQLPIRDKTDTIAEVTRQQFFGAYANLSGCTATATECESELRAVYGLGCEVMEPRLASQRQVWPMTWCRSEHAALTWIAREAQTLSKSGRSVLVATRDITTNHAAGKAFGDSEIPFALLDGIQDAAEASLVAAAGQPGTITIATQVAGRGTDIRLANATRAAGGLHVIVFGIEPNRRVEEQVIGRCARGGDPGSTRLVFHAEDPVLLARAPWIARSIERHCTTDLPAAEIESSIATTIRRHLRRLQNTWRSEQQRARDQVHVDQTREPLTPKRSRASFRRIA
ncbi:MAG: preprotein translocase subunit SecA [Planctomycetota bacterium]